MYQTITSKDFHVILSSIHQINSLNQISLEFDAIKAFFYCHSGKMFFSRTVELCQYVCSQEMCCGLYMALSGITISGHQVFLGPTLCICLGWWHGKGHGPCSSYFFWGGGHHSCTRVPNMIDGWHCLTEILRLIVRTLL